MKGKLLALALLTAGCARHSGSSAAPEPEQKTTVQVKNQNFSDMNVFVLGAGQRVRLGFVTGLSTQTFTLPADIVRISPQIQFEIHPIGANRNPISETINVIPGDQVTLTIPPQ
ncbi:MAG: hypothetical protein DMD62_11490 [Gemmatimonadetes bacterium]|nr:MAG: hypothetical protein DMD62_11490 [Gemmatimonadota bacterium]